MVYLLDVNVLLAFCDHHHVHHEAAHRWFTQTRSRQWATCPMTENGFLRILGGPAYPNHPGGPAAAGLMLQRIQKMSGYHFWHDSKSILEMFRFEILISSNHITDIYLLGLAMAHKGKLATFDQKIPVNAISGGADAIEILN